MAAQNAGAYRFAHADKRDTEKLARDFHHVYNLAWAKHSGVKLMSLDQARSIVKEMGPVLDERLLWFGYHGDEPVAFFISLPELNQIFKHVGRRLNLLGKLRFLWARWRYQRQRTSKMFGIIYGVVPEHQGKGVDAAMLYYAQQAVMNGRLPPHRDELDWRFQPPHDGDDALHRGHHHQNPRHLPLPVRPGTAVRAQPDYSVECGINESLRVECSPVQRLCFPAQNAPLAIRRCLLERVPDGQIEAAGFAGSGVP